MLHAQPIAQQFNSLVNKVQVTFRITCFFSCSFLCLHFFSIVSIKNSHWKLNLSLIWICQKNFTSHISSFFSQFFSSQLQLISVVVFFRTSFVNYFYSPQLFACSTNCTLAHWRTFFVTNATFCGFNSYASTGELLLDKSPLFKTPWCENLGSVSAVFCLLMNCTHCSTFVFAASSNDDCVSWDFCLFKPFSKALANVTLCFRAQTYSQVLVAHSKKECFVSKCQFVHQSHTSLVVR